MQAYTAEIKKTPSHALPSKTPKSKAIPILRFTKNIVRITKMAKPETMLDIISASLSVAFNFNN